MQVYSYAADRGLDKLVSYLVQEREEQNIVAVLQSGDLIENNALESEWKRIAASLKPLRGKIPFYCIIGNHDLGYGVSKINVSEYGLLPYFRYDLCDVRDPEQQFKGGVCWYQFIGDRDLLLLGIGWPRESGFGDRIEWLNDVLDRYPDVPTLILIHNFLYNDGKETEIGLKLERELIKKHPNVRLLLCGHHRGVRRLTKSFHEGIDFTAVMYNLQEETKKASGYCMLITFDPVTRSVSFTSYSPVYDDYNYLDDPTLETFTLENAY